MLFKTLVDLLGYSTNRACWEGISLKVQLQDYKCFDNTCIKLMYCTYAFKYAWYMYHMRNGRSAYVKQKRVKWRNEHIDFFFKVFQNFMVPLDSSWWDLFKSAVAPKYTICTQVAFGTYLWIFFIFTSVPILKKSCL